jgi:hypothetical protein
MSAKSIPCGEAIDYALQFLMDYHHLWVSEEQPTEKDREYKQEVQNTLQAILDQKGAEHLDPAVTDGKLTTFMDVAILG